MSKMKIQDWLAYVILLIGGLNWGLIGSFNFNLVETIFGTGLLTDIIYVIVGLAGLYGIFTAIKLAMK